MGGELALLRIRVRADGIIAAVWVVGTVAIFAATASACAGMFTTAAARTDYATAVEANRALQAINGHPYGADTLGGIIADEFGFLVPILIPLIAVVTTARATTADEAAGRMELMRSRGVARLTPVSVAVAWGSAASLLVGAGFAVALVTQTVPAAPSVAYGAGIAALGLVWVGITALAAQLFAHPSAVRGAALIAIAFAYLTRALGYLGDSWVKWLSPLVWMQELRPFATTRWWPVALPVATAALLTIAAIVVARRRDLGAGALPQRSGQAELPVWARGPWGFAVRTHLASLSAWVCAAIAVGAMFGSLAGVANSELSSDLDFAQTLGTDATPTDTYLMLSLVFVVVLTGCCAVHGVDQVRQDERAGRVEVVLARARSRTSWLAAHAVVVAAGTAATGMLGGLALGGSAQVATGQSLCGDIVGAAAAFLLAAATMEALAIALLGVVPRAQAVAWALPAWCGVVAVLGTVIDFPRWATALSPMDDVGRLPIDPVSPSGAWSLVAATVVLAAVGILGARRRDIPQ